MHQQLAVITGTTRGLGQALADSLTERGWSVTGISRPCFDLGDLDYGALDRAIAAVSGAPVERAVLILNACALHIQSAAELLPSDIERNIRINITSAIALAGIFLRHFPAGEIAYITSGAARHGLPHWSLYCAAKAAMEGYLRAVEAEGIKTYAIEPGLIDTEMQKQIRNIDFAWRSRFISYKEEGQLQSPDRIAEVVLSTIGVAAHAQKSA